MSRPSSPTKGLMTMPRLDLAKIASKPGFERPEVVDTTNPVLVPVYIEAKNDDVKPVSLTDTTFKPYIPKKEKEPVRELSFTPPSPRLNKPDYEDKRNQYNQKMFKTLSELDPYMTKSIMGDTNQVQPDVVPSTPRSLQTYNQKMELRKASKAAGTIQKVWRGYIGRKVYHSEFNDMMERREQEHYEKEKNELERGFVLTESEEIQDQLREEENHNRFVMNQRVQAARTLQHYWREYATRFSRRSNNTSTNNSIDEYSSDSDDDASVYSNDWVKNIFAKYLAYQGEVETDESLPIGDPVEYRFDVRACLGSF